MFRAALGFFLLALLSVVLGASGVGGVSLDIGRALLLTFIILAVLSFVAGLITEAKKPPGRY